MTIPFDKNLISFAKKLDKPLYAVGGVVRNFLVDKTLSEDVDLAAAIPVEGFLLALKDSGFTVVCEYKRTGTVVFEGNGKKYEYTAFRKDGVYSRGEHTPALTEFTEDILEDALRRDFKCNAVYYDIAGENIVDLLGGTSDISNRILDTVKEPKEVFKSDGLRLLRLARFAGELGFTPTIEVLNAAKTYAENISDISPERIFSELNKILHADKKYSFSDKEGHYKGLKILDETRVLDYVFPELTEGRGMAQRADFHKYDVLEHSLRSTLYAHESVRLAALLHDVGKPFCMKRDGWYRYHYVEGVYIADRILKRLKAPTATIKQVKYLIKEHMVDLDCSMKEKRVRKFLVKNYENLDELLLVKQADFRASLETDEECPTLVKWNKIISAMKEDGTPFTIKELNVSAKLLEALGYKNASIGKELKRLWAVAVDNPKLNNETSLLKIAASDFKIH